MDSWIVRRREKGVVDPDGHGIAEPPARLVGVDEPHVTPDATNDIAMGMNRISLNAVDHLTRSISTAKISPTMVTTAGTMATHSRLFLKARKFEGSVKMLP